MYNKLAQTASFLLAFIFLAPDLLASARATELIVQSFYEPYSTSKSRGILLPQPAVNDIYRTEGDHTPADYRTSEDVTKNRKVSGPAAAIFMLRAEEEVAYLGDHPADPMHLPADDVFNIRIEPSQLQKEVYAYLTYRISGLEDGLSLPKSINGAPAFVSSRPQKKEGWQKVTHTISTSLLKAGMNEIRFNAPHNLKASVEVRDVEITLSTQISNSPALSQVARPEASSEGFKASMDSLPLSALSVQDVDMPAIPRNITNVTANSWGYLVPQGAGQPIRVKLGVNRLKVPAGTSLSEVRLFFFDQVSQSWQATHVEHIDMATASLEAQGPGGTNYFAGLIKTPEMPEASAFMPTTISDIKAANPAAEMNIMQPPSVSQTGEARINYPLVIPAGRQGVQPNVNLTYSSDAGTGWMGVGWNINVPSVNIDTRWGVPTFDPNLESEIYSLNGESLNREDGVKANRAPGTRLTSLDSVHFFPKTMSGYKRIVRYGTDPTNYRWEEVSAGGMHFYYGTTDGVGLDNGSVLKDESGNVLRWYLKRVEDRWGNRITYNYVPYNNTTTGNIKSGGKQLVLDNIRYTGYDTDPGNYEIVFETSGNRQDGRVMMNLGQKELDDRQLNSIKVNYYDNGTPEEVKRFDFHYINGDFEVHPLLEKVVEYRSGEYFYKHTFEYHHGQLDFEDEQQVSIGHFNNRLFDEMPGELAAISGPLGDLTSASGIKTTITNGWGAGGSIGLGIAPLTFPYPSKTFTFSGRLGQSQTESRDKLSLDDMNGDGLPDLIYDKGNGARYHPLRIDETGQFSFNGFHRINISGDLLESYSRTFTYGFDFALPLNVYYYGMNWNKTRSRVQRYLTDYNADGIKDLVLANGGVPMIYFGALSKSGEVRFDPSSEHSVNAVVKGTTPITPPEPQDTLKDLELVRVWIAPYDGYVDIDGIIDLKYTTDDYVYAAIQKNGSFEIGMTAITDTVTPTDMIKNNVWVDKDDTLTFRLRSNQNGYGDVVKWSPEVSYQSGTKKDGNGSNYGHTEYRDNFLLSAFEAARFWGDEALKISWPVFGVSGMSDDVTLRIHITAQDVASEAVVMDEHYDYIIPRSSSQVPSPSQFKTPGQSSAPSFMNSLTLISGLDSDHLCHLTFEVLSTSNVDWKDVDWRPKVEFGPECGEANSIQYPAVYYQTYNRVAKMEAPYTTSLGSGTHLIAWPYVNTSNFSEIFHDEELGQGGSYQAYMVVKGNNQILYAVLLDIFENSISYYEVPAVFGDPGSTSLNLSQAAANYSFPVSSLSNGEVYIEYFAPNRRIGEVLKDHATAYLYEVIEGNTGEPTEVLDVNVFFQERSEFNDFLLGWGQFCWSNLGQNAIPTSEMKLDRSLAENNDYREGEPPTTSSLDNNQALQDMNPMEQEFWPLNAVRGERPLVKGSPVKSDHSGAPESLDRWSVLGGYVAAYGSEGLTVPGKFGEEPRRPQLLPPASPGTFGALATLQHSKSFTLALSAGPSIPDVGISYVHSSTINDKDKYYSESLTSFMDINGDAYPDILSSSDGVDAFITDPQGGHRSNSVDVASGQLTKSVTNNQADVVSGTFVNDDVRFLNMKTSASAGFSVSMGESETIIEWMDMNGDGLADRIDKLSSSSVKLELNNGSTLLSAVPLASTGSQLSDNLSIGLNAGLGALENNESGLGLSFSGGIGINKAGGESKKMYMDMNGDGLTDLIEESGGNLKLYLNTGTTFQLYSSANLSQLEELNKMAGLGISGNIAGSYAFPLGSFLAFHFKMSVSGNVQSNYATNNQLSSFRDMNGDGLVDYIRDEDGGLNIYLSKVGKSNLLKKVTNSLKGTFVIDYERKGNRYGAYPVEVPIHNTAEDEKVIWDMPNSKWVMKSLVVDDGLHMENGSQEDIDGWDDMEFTFRYDGGVKSRREREFLGFTRVEKSYRPNREDIPLLANNDDPRKFWIAEVSDYFRPNKNDPHYRKRFEYMKGLSPDNYTLLHEEWRIEVLQESGATYVEDNYEITMMAHDRREFEFREVGIDRSDNLNFTKVVIENEEFVPVNWGIVSETQTLFPAVTATEQIKAPQLAPLHDKVNKDKYLMSRYEIAYDQYFNVTEYVDQGISAEVNTQLVVVDTIVEERYEFYELEFTNLDIENRNPPFNEPIYNNGSGEFCFLMSVDDYGADTLCLSDYILNPPEESPCWDKEPPSGGDTETYSITLRRKVTETIYIEEEQHSTNFSAPVFAWMEYFLPDEAAGRTNVLEDHKIYIGDTQNGLTRHSHVDDLTIDKKAVKVMAQYSTSSVKSLTDFEYDVYGNVTRIKGPENHQNQRMTVDFSYDNDVHHFITNVSNSYGDQSCSVYDPATGKLLKSVDINGNVMGYDYDDYHRLVGVFAPDAFKSVGQSATIGFSYHPSGIDSAMGHSSDYLLGVPVAITRHNINPQETLDDADACWNGIDGNPANDCDVVCDFDSRPAMSNPLHTASFMDGIQRVVQIKKEVPKANSAGTDNIKQKLVSGLAEYDRQWRDSTLSLQVEELNSYPLGKLNTAKSAYYQSKNTFDYAGRVQKQESIREASGSFSETSMVYEWSDLDGTSTFSTESTMHGQTQRNFINSKGQTLASVQAAFPTTYFVFDPLNQLQEVKDPLGLKTTYKYDFMGRVTEETHPDRGVSTFTYDPASNLRKIETDEIKPYFIRLDYHYNRLSHKLYPNTNNLNETFYTYGSRNDGNNGAGRVTTVAQGTNFKTENYKYDALGNRIYEKKTLSVPKAGTLNFTTQFEYDSWGRIRWVEYPDGEKVNYSYGNAGELEGINPTLPPPFSGPDNPIIDKILYDGFENIKTIEYSNNTVTNFTYNAYNRALKTQKLDVLNGASQSATLLDKVFSYDARGNVSGVVNNTSTAVSAGGVDFGGPYDHTYSYDPANRLNQSVSNYGVPQNGNQKFLQLDLTYNDAGGIKTKKQLHKDEQGNFLPAHTYDLWYTYKSATHQLDRVQYRYVYNPPPNKGIGDFTGEVTTFIYNLEGSITRPLSSISGTVTLQENIRRDEEQQITAVRNDKGVHHYVYDHNGERILKTTLYEYGTAQNGQGQGTSADMAPYAVYVNPYYVATHYLQVAEVSKHYYMGSQRVASALINYPFTASTGTGGGGGGPEPPEGSSGPLNAILQDLQDALEAFNQEYAVEELDIADIEDYDTQANYQSMSANCPPGDDQCLCEISWYWAEKANVDCSQERIMYWYHPDYLGHTEAITNQAGQPYQYFLFSAFGETIEQQHGTLGSYSSPYRFNGKEYDQETGNYYYGARYYDPKLSIWLSVDPMSSERSWLTPYNFVQNNPIMWTDPTGMLDGGPGDPQDKISPGGYVPAEEYHGEVVAQGPSPQTNSSYNGPYSSEYYDDLNSPEPSLLSRFYNDGMVRAGEDAREGLIMLANDLIDGDPEAWLDFLSDPFGLGQPGGTTQVPQSAEEAGYETMMAIPLLIGKGKNKPKSQIRNYKPSSTKKHFVLHPNAKTAQQASGQPRSVKPETHNKSTSRGQRPHYHDINDANIHHTWGKAKNKKR